jgi:hypothetical protein
MDRRVLASSYITSTITNIMSTFENTNQTDLELELRYEIENAEICKLAKLDPAIVHSCHLCEDYDYDYDDGSQPPRAKDIARRSHDDGFDEYDGDDEVWETASQEEERRQEMAEENERQMEAYYGDLNRSIFEHNSSATADPHIRITYAVSPILPDNWLEIAMRGVK